MAWQSIDLRSLWSVVYRNRYILIGALAVCVTLGIIITFLSTPIYRATARIQIDMESAQIIKGGDVQPQSGVGDADRYLETQVDILESRTLAREVATQLGLLRNNAFLEQMGMKQSESAEASPAVDRARLEQVLGVLDANLKVKLPVDSSVVNIAFDSPDRNLSARIANSFAENYITSNLSRKYDTSSYARQFLEGQLRQTRQRLEESERALIDYARGARLIDTSSGGGTGSGSLTASSLVQLNQSLSQTVAARIAAEQRWLQAQSTPLMNLAIVQQNGAISALVQQRAQLRAQYQQNSLRYDANYPTQRELQTQIDASTAQITRLATELRDGIRQDYVIAQRQEAGLEKQIAGLKNMTLAEQDRSVRYNILRRDLDTNRTLYDGLLQRYKEISAAAGITANNISIVDRADPPGGTVRPRPLLNLALSIVAGLLLGAGLAFLRENFDDAIRSTSDVERMLGLPAIGVIPKLKEEMNVREAMNDRKSDMSEAYAALRSALQLSTSTGAPKSLIFTSSGPAEGKSTSALAIARSFAQIGHKVVLIDADMRRPSQHKRFEVDNQKGLSNVLASQASLEDVLIKTDQPGLDLVTAGPIPINPAELIAGPGMLKLVNQCEQTYDMVVIDSPPVLGLADAPTLASDVGSMVFVVEANRVHGRRANDALGRLSGSNARILGVLLTKFDAKAIGYYSSDYGYIYSYGNRPAKD
ncbi:hypothetical protein ASG67_15500 [Sphingomonas sp. Leaf339]|nr:hypothetical protein ASG67_15500 [Sphingomonas sp. Leaf339]